MSFTKRGFCRLAFWVFAAFYGFAVLILLIGTYGWFGQERDPLAGAYLMPLGLPWTGVLTTLLGEAGAWSAVLAPLLNLVLLGGLCKLARRQDS